MLDDRETEAGAADGTAVGLVNAEEALPDAVQVLLRDADAVILYRDGPAFTDDVDMPIRMVVLDGVIDEIIDHLLDVRTDTGDFCAAAREVDAYLMLHRLIPQTMDDRLRKEIEVHRLLFHLDTGFQSAEMHDVIDQRQQTLRLIIDGGRELPNMGRIGHHTILHKLCEAGNARERCFQLVRDIGRKFFSYLL